MFGGDAVGVGLTVHQLDDQPAPPGGWPVPDGVVVRPSRIGEVLPVAERTGAQLAAELGRIVVAQAQLAAYQAEVVCALAALRPDADDRRQGDPGAASPDWLPGPEHPPAGVSEFFVDELALALGTSKTSAHYVWQHASTLRTRLPATWAALADGRLDWPRGRAIATEVAGVDVEPGVLGAVEDAVLPVASSFTVTGLKLLVRAELLARDETAADKRRRRAARAADVHVTPTGEGRAMFAADLSAEDAAACREVADHYARLAKTEGDKRPIGVIRAEVVRDLMLHPAHPDQPAVTAHLTVHASLDALQAAAARADRDHPDTATTPIPDAATAPGPQGTPSPAEGAGVAAAGDSNARAAATGDGDPHGGEPRDREGAREARDADDGGAAGDGAAGGQAPGEGSTGGGEPDDSEAAGNPEASDPEATDPAASDPAASDPEASGDDRAAEDALSAFYADGRRVAENISPPEPPPAPIATLNEQPITAAHLRAFLEAIDALCPGGLQAPTGGTLSLALTDPNGALRAVLTRPQLQRLAARGCPTHPDGDCDCGLIDRPPRVDRYAPTPAQYRFIRTRDRGCRMPGCTARAAWADLDHVLAHNCGGPTDCTNLCCLCRRHHRLKTFAPGWTFRLTDDGTLTVTTPSGITRSTRPPGLHPPPDQPTPDDDPTDDDPTPTTTSVAKKPVRSGIREALSRPWTPDDPSLSADAGDWPF